MVGFFGRVRVADVTGGVLGDLPGEAFLGGM